MIASELETEGLRGDLRRGEMVGEQTVMFIRMIIINQSVDSQQPNMCSLLICPGAAVISKCLRIAMVGSMKSL